MSQKREKKRRRLARYDYQFQLERWRSFEPLWCRFISHWLWKKKKPTPPKGVKRC